MSPLLLAAAPLQGACLPDAVRLPSRCRLEASRPPCRRCPLPLAAPLRGECPPAAVSQKAVRCVPAVPPVVPHPSQPERPQGHTPCEGESVGESSKFTLPVRTNSGRSGGIGVRCDRPGGGTPCGRYAGFPLATPHHHHTCWLPLAPSCPAVGPTDAPVGVTPPQPWPPPAEQLHAGEGGGVDVNFEVRRRKMDCSSWWDTTSALAASPLRIPLTCRTLPLSTFPFPRRSFCSLPAPRSPAAPRLSSSTASSSRASHSPRSASAHCST